MKENRQATRSLCADLVKICWKDEAGSRRKEVATLEDISSRGACLQLEHPIPEGTEISVLYPNGRYQGTIRYCIFDLTGYFVGVEFAVGYRWSRRQFKPSHLLDLELLRNRKDE